MNVAWLVNQFARSAEQTAVLQGDWRVFYSRQRTGAICYRLKFGTVLSPGDPLCEPEHTGEVLREFLDLCRLRRWHAVFVPSSGQFAVLAAQLGCAGWKIGETPVFDLQAWQLGGSAGAALRAALNRARRAGARAAEWRGVESNAIPRSALQAVCESWRSGRGMPLGFILNSDPLAARSGRRWFVVELDSKVQAIAVTAALPGVSGVAIEHFIRRPGAEYGSVELAVSEAFERHRDEGLETGLLAVTPLRGLRPGEFAGQGIIGRPDRGHRVGLAALRLLRRQESLYQARSLEHFKQKFNPGRWENAYLVHYPAKVLPRMGVAAALELFPGGPHAWGASALTAVTARAVDFFAGAG